MAASSSANRWATRISVVAALVGAWFLLDFVSDQAEHQPWGVGVIVAAAVGFAVLIYHAQDRRCERARRAESTRRIATGEAAHVPYDDPRFVPDRSWIAPMAILAIAAIWGVTAGIRARDNYIRPYCLYGAKSQAQLDGCLSHVSSDSINDLDTQAARFARGETSDCLADSGPFCAGASRWNGIEPPGPNE